MEDLCSNRISKTSMIFYEIDAGASSELDYTEQTSWLLFFKYMDDLEKDKAMDAELEGKTYSYILDEPYRWESWAY
jgi:type I restriction enzyme M protein